MLIKGIPTDSMIHGVTPEYLRSLERANLERRGLTPMEFGETLGDQRAAAEWQRLEDGDIEADDEDDDRAQIHALVARRFLELL